MANAKPLEELRREVDAIDDALHDLLMRRAAVTDAIARTKPRTRGHIPLALAMRPAREAEIMRRFVARHTGSPPIGTVIRVIREVLAASLAAQTPVRVHVVNEPAIGDLAHAYFGAETKLIRHDTASAVVRACAGDADSIGVVPSFSGEQWWSQLSAFGAKSPRVIARLPFLAGDDEVLGGYAIAAIEQEPTGDDSTLLVAKVPSDPKELGAQLVAANFSTRAIVYSYDGYMLIEVGELIAHDDPRLAKLGARSIGGFANPAMAKKKEPAR
jgi:chorismate mutase / prephenate dehydratase